MIISKELRDTIPSLYRNNVKNIPIKDQVAHVRLFCPANGWAWYVLEMGTDTIYGYTVGFESELGYTHLPELEETMAVFLDTDFKPTPLGELFPEVFH